MHLCYLQTQPELNYLLCNVADTTRALQPNWEQVSLLHITISSISSCGGDRGSTERELLQAELQNPMVLSAVGRADKDTEHLPLHRALPWRIKDTEVA